MQHRNSANQTSFTLRARSRSRERTRKVGRLASLGRTLAGIESHNCGRRRDLGHDLARLAALISFSITRSSPISASNAESLERHSGRGAGACQTPGNGPSELDRLAPQPDPSAATVGRVDELGRNLPREAKEVRGSRPGNLHPALSVSGEGPRHVVGRGRKSAELRVGAWHIVEAAPKAANPSRADEPRERLVHGGAASDPE